MPEEENEATEQPIIDPSTDRGDDEHVVKPQPKKP